MKIIWLFFMTMAFGIISMITSKKYNLKGELKELRFPTAFSYMVNNSSSRKRYASPKAGTELYLDLVFRQ